MPHRIFFLPNLNQKIINKKYEEENKIEVIDYFIPKKFLEFNSQTTTSLNSLGKSNDDYAILILKNSLPEFGYFGLKYSYSFFNPENFKNKNKNKKKIMKQNKNLFYCGYETKINQSGKFEAKLNNINEPLTIKVNNKDNNNDNNDIDYKFSTFNCLEGMNGAPLLFEEENNFYIFGLLQINKFTEANVIPLDFEKFQEIEKFLNGYENKFYQQYIIEKDFQKINQLCHIEFSFYQI